MIRDPGVTLSSRSHRERRRASAHRPGRLRADPRQYRPGPSNPHPTLDIYLFDNSFWQAIGFLDCPGNASTWKPYGALFMRHCLDNFPKHSCQNEFSLSYVVVPLTPPLPPRPLSQRGCQKNHHPRSSLTSRPRQKKTLTKTLI